MQNTLTPKTGPISGISSVWLERVIWDHEAVGSSPTSPTTARRSPQRVKHIHKIATLYLDIVQFGRTLPWGGRGRRFESCYSDHMGCPPNYESSVTTDKIGVRPVGAHSNLILLKNNCWFESNSKLLNSLD